MKQEMAQAELQHQKSIDAKKVVKLQSQAGSDLKAQVDALKQEKMIQNERLATLMEEKEKLQNDYRQQLQGVMSQKQDLAEKLTAIENELSRSKQERDKAKL